MDIDKQSKEYRKIVNLKRMAKNPKRYGLKSLKTVDVYAVLSEVMDLAQNAKNKPAIVAVVEIRGRFDDLVNNAQRELNEINDLDALS